MTEVAKQNEWATSLTEQAVSKLNKHATEIHKLHHDTVQYMAQKQIEVGRILLEARKEFVGDNEFGKWRAANTPIGSRQTAHNLMKLAEQAGTGRITKQLIEALPTSTLAELITAPDSVLKVIADRVADGEHVTAREIREERKAQEPAPEVAKSKATESKAAAVAAADKAVAAKGLPEEEFFANIVEEELFRVIEWFVDKRADEKVGKAMNQQWAMCLFGVPPYSTGVPRWRVFQLMRADHERLRDEGELKKWAMDILDSAWEVLKKMYDKQA